MPWKASSVMDERVKFVGRLLSGEKMAPLCREFGISRVTGHKIWNRYRDQGSPGIKFRSRAPHAHPNQTSFDVEQIIVRLKKEKPHWGAPKIRELVIRRHPQVRVPSISTIHCILDRHGLVKRTVHRSKFSAVASYLSTPHHPNDLWCVDFKGQFRMTNRAYCFPLTITDFQSRYLISCEALAGTEENASYGVFEEAFATYGLPGAIRSDNGVPFASGNSLWGLTKLSVWWIRLGIKLERIRPGNPQQNGRHERMHRTLKLEATRPAGANLLQQQDRFYRFMDEYNQERPHQALAMKRPADLYEPSPRKYRGLPPLTYPDQDKTLIISSCGRVCLQRAKIHLSKAFANQPVGLTEVEDQIWSVAFMDYEIGFFDEPSRKFAPKEDPFGMKLDKAF
jgi:putative transposase